MTKQIYFLHADAHGRELKFEFEPSGEKRLPCVKVEVFDDYDQVYTSNVTTLVVRPNPPRGVGWEMFDNSSDNYTIWRRPLVKEE